MEFNSKGEAEKGIKIKIKGIKKNQKIIQDKNKRFSKRKQEINFTSINNKEKINIDYPYILYQSKKRLL